MTYSATGHGDLVESVRRRMGCRRVTVDVEGIRERRFHSGVVKVGQPVVVNGAEAQRHRAVHRVVHCRGIGGNKRRRE